MCSITLRLPSSWPLRCEWLSILICCTLCALLPNQSIYVFSYKFSLDKCQSVQVRCVHRFHLKNEQRGWLAGYSHTRVHTNPFLDNNHVDSLKFYFNVLKIGRKWNCTESLLIMWQISAINAFQMSSCRTMMMLELLAFYLNLFLNDRVLVNVCIGTFSRKNGRVFSLSLSLALAADH